VKNKKDKKEVVKLEASKIPIRTENVTLNKITKHTVYNKSEGRSKSVSRQTISREIRPLIDQKPLLPPITSVSIKNYYRHKMTH